MKNKFMSVLLLCGLALLGCGYKHRPMVNPQVEILNKVSIDQVKTTIGRVLRVIGWRVESENPGVTVASLQKGELFAKIKVEYTETQININYIDSRNFNYSKRQGKWETIHSHYLSWVNHVAESVGKALNTLPAK